MDENQQDQKAQAKEQAREEIRERVRDVPFIAGTTAAVCAFTLVNTFLKENTEASSMFHSARLRVGRLTAATAAAIKAGNEVDRFVTELRKK